MLGRYGWRGWGRRRRRCCSREDGRSEGGEAGGGTEWLCGSELGCVAGRAVGGRSCWHGARRKGRGGKWGWRCWAGHDAAPRSTACVVVRRTPCAARRSLLFPTLTPRASQADAYDDVGLVRADEEPDVLCQRCFSLKHSG